MPRPRLDPRVDPPLVRGDARRRREEDAQLIDGLTVNGVQTGAARAAANRAMIAHMRAVNYPALKSEACR